jgi:hypothetical protein
VLFEFFFCAAMHFRFEFTLVGSLADFDLSFEVLNLCLVKCCRAELKTAHERTQLVRLSSKQ